MDHCLIPLFNKEQAIQSCVKGGELDEEMWI